MGYHSITTKIVMFSEFRFITVSFSFYSCSDDEIPSNLRPEKVIEYLEGCECVGLCTVENGCTCRSESNRDRDVYNEEVSV